MVAGDGGDVDSDGGESVRSWWEYGFWSCWRGGAGR